jgi:hypothetical protein
MVCNAVINASVAYSMSMTCPFGSLPATAHKTASSVTSPHSTNSELRGPHQQPHLAQRHRRRQRNHKHGRALTSDPHHTTWEEGTPVPLHPLAGSSRRHNTTTTTTIIKGTKILAVVPGYQVFLSYTYNFGGKSRKPCLSVLNHLPAVHASPPLPSKHRFPRALPRHERRRREGEEDEGVPLL